MNPEFMGTWDLDSSKTVGLEDFGKVMGMDAAKIEAYSKMTYSFTLSQEGETYKIDVDFKGAMPNMNYAVKVGETIDYTGSDGTKSKLTLNLDGTNPVESYEIPDKNVTWNIRRTVSGNELTTVTSVGPASMTQTLTRK